MVWKKNLLDNNSYKSILGRNWQLLIYTALQLGIFSSTVAFCADGQLGPVWRTGKLMCSRSNRVWEAGGCLLSAGCDTWIVGPESSSASVKCRGYSMGGTCSLNRREHHKAELWHTDKSRGRACVAQGFGTGTSSKTFPAWTEIQVWCI